MKRKTPPPDLTAGFAHPKRRAQPGQQITRDAMAALMSMPVSSVRAQPKPLPALRCRGYLDYVALQPCCCPGCKADPAGDPHHEGPRGVGQKTDDLLVVPLCRTHHRFVEDKLHLPEMTRAETEALFARVQIRFLVRWLRETGVWGALQEAGLVPR